MDSWKLTYNGWNSKEEKLREVLCTLGNGYFATRGAVEERIDDGCHYPGTYLSGGYNRVESEVAGKIIENEDLVNWPNWLCLSFRIDGGKWFDLADVNIKKYLQELDFQKGTLSREIIFIDKLGRKTSLVSKRLVSMWDKNTAAIHWTLDALNWSGKVEVRTALDANIENKGVDRYKALNGNHLELLETGQFGEDSIYLLVQTNQSHIQMAQASSLKVYQKNEKIPIVAKRKTKEEKRNIIQVLSFEVEQHHPVCVEKIVSLYTSHDLAISEPLLEAQKKVQRIKGKGFEYVLGKHEMAWKQLWERNNLMITCNIEALAIIRLHMFHIFQTVSPHTITMDAGVPARGLHGEAYRGHIFWDELFIFPFLNYCTPDITQALLMYRYRRLNEARYAAQEAGYEGAMFPWQSGSNGREESQHIHLNPKSGRWLPDNTYLQRHINSAIAYNIWQYYQVTEDMEFMNFYGAEMFLEIARFWASIATFNKSENRYEIDGVVGPDEYHTEYPGSDSPGLKNNAYTNFMAAWVLQCALKVLRLLDEKRQSELLAMLEIPEDEIQHWDIISKNMYIPFLKGGIISQFEGYGDLKELDWKFYRDKYGDNMRLDRILESEGDSTNNYKVSKQADVLMLFYLFSSEELQRMFNLMNIPFDPQSIPDNIDFYAERTSHGSTLSRIVYSWVWSRSKREKSWYNFEEALISDIHDIQGGTTPEGIHLGAMAGTIDLVQRCYTGLEVRDEILWVNPALPEGISCLKFKIRYRSHILSISIEDNTLKLSFDSGWWGQEIQIGVRDKIYDIKKGQTKSIPLRKAKRKASLSK